MFALWVFSDEIAKLFPQLFGQPSALLVPTGSAPSELNKTIKVGVVLSGGQAPGGHNVISGIFGESSVLPLGCDPFVHFYFIY